MRVQQRLFFYYDTNLEIPLFFKFSYVLIFRKLDESPLCYISIIFITTSPSINKCICVIKKNTYMYLYGVYFRLPHPADFFKDHLTILRSSNSLIFLHKTNHHSHPPESCRKISCNTIPESSCRNKDFRYAECGQ